MPRPTDPERRARLQALFADHYDAIWRYATRRVGADAVENVVAETFLVAWRRIYELPDAELAWLYEFIRDSVAETDTCDGGPMGNSDWSHVHTQDYAPMGGRGALHPAACRARGDRRDVRRAA